MTKQETIKQRYAICGMGVCAGVLTLNLPLILFSGFMTGVVKLGEITSK